MRSYFKAFPSTPQVDYLLFSFLDYRYLTSVHATNKRVCRKKIKKNIGASYFVRSTENYSSNLLSTTNI
jgi:hypothetical protein